jgi:hypothetical protein
MPQMAEPGENLRALVQRAGLSPEQFARRLNKYAVGLGLSNQLDPKTPYKWFRGAAPREPWPALVAAVLGAELATDLRVEELGWKAANRGIEYVSANTGLLLPWTASGAVTAISEVTEPDAMNRRVFLQLVGGSLTEPALDWLIARPAGDIENAAGRRILHDHVDGVEQITAQLRRMDDQFGGGTVLDLVQAHIRHVLNLLRNHRYTASVGTRLHGAAAELLRLAGWLSFDAGHQAQAQRYWLAALRGAHAADDRALGANVLGFMSCQAKDLEQYGEATKLAEAARQGYAGASPRVAAILNLRAAEAYAQTGEVAECRNAIDAAYEALRATPPESGDPDWSYWLDEAQVNAQAGYCYLRLEDWPRSQSHLRTALRLQDDIYSREAALRQALLAVTYARQGDPEQACEVGTRAVDLLAEDVDSQRCIGHVRRVQRALDPYRRVGTVVDFNERADRLFGVPA